MPVNQHAIFEQKSAFSSYLTLDLRKLNQFLNQAIFFP
jgi:hypothetical protein